MSETKDKLRVVLVLCHHNCLSMVDVATVTNCLHDLCEVRFDWPTENEVQWDESRPNRSEISDLQRSTKRKQYLCGLIVDHGSASLLRAEAINPSLRPRIIICSDEVLPPEREQLYFKKGYSRFWTADRIVQALAALIKDLIRQG